MSVTTILKVDERCEEVARMISGTDVTDLTLQNAGEMLRMAQEHS